MVIQGGVHTVMSRGDIIVKEKSFIGLKGRGKYLRRDIASVIH